ncbi:unnamed protein product [Phytomonas sp. Hart1]|nr:unnamed protein product [Phytomonas sp. Hart1]|eukprot:CCW67996.1 unnamed protein product [Phytomonas sp. isolate Hart1]
MYARTFSTTVLLILCVLAWCDFRVFGKKGSEEICSPWSLTGPACQYLERLNLRFIVDLAEENYKEDRGNTIQTAVYGFAPEVDRLQLFTLSDAAALASVSMTGGPYVFSASLTKKYLSVYGFGNTNSIVRPEYGGYSNAAVVLVEKDSSVCGGTGTVAVATILNLDVGLHHGLFNYESGAQTILTTNPKTQPTTFEETPGVSSSPAYFPFSEEWGGDGGLGKKSTMSGLNTNAKGFPILSEVFSVKQPLKTGFAPTCGNTKDGEKCLWDKTQVCIGDLGRRNCARCYSDLSELVKSAKVMIVASYYGTDLLGRTLTSGTVNPLNFREFAGKDVIKNIRKAVKF